MALRAVKPEAVIKRLKMLMHGPAGVGKSTAAIQFPHSYIIDSEKGTENYDKLITASGSAVFHTTDINEVIQEVKSLLSEKHEYRTLVIDPITPIYDDLVAKSEVKVGTDFGRHFGEANKTMKRMVNLIMQLDMNVVVTAHSKREYGDGMKVLGYTFDGWKKLDYVFDLFVELVKEGAGELTERKAVVVKSRLPEHFRDGEKFDWSYDEIRRRWDAAVLEKQSSAVALATADQVREMERLLNVVKLPEGTAAKWLAKVGADSWEDMPADAIGKCIKFVKSKLPAAA